MASFALRRRAHLTERVTARFTVIRTSVDRVPRNCVKTKPPVQQAMVLVQGNTKIRFDPRGRPRRLTNHKRKGIQHSHGHAGASMFVFPGEPKGATEQGLMMNSG